MASLETFLQTSIESSFRFITKRNDQNKINKKNISNIFHLYSCRYFAACCYVDYLLRNKLINPEDKKHLITEFTYLPQLSSKRLSVSLRDHFIYPFDSSFNKNKQNSVMICYIYKDTDDGINSIHHFILDSSFENDVIYNSWLTSEPKSMKNKTFSIDELNGKRVYDDEQERYNVLMPSTKVVVYNVYKKLLLLFKEPTLALIKLLFGINETHIITDHFNISHFKGAKMFYVKKI